MTLRVFLGYDKKETVAYHVAAHSIMRRSSIPVSITPINRDNMKFYTRPRGEYDSTDFSNSRFLVPFLCDYQGWAVFMDSDILCLGDIAEFGGYASLANEYGAAVRLVKHDYEPAEKNKFLGAAQTTYSRKNWSSVMLFNNKMCQKLTLDYCHTANGLDLHQFKWVTEEQVRELPKVWNHLVGEANQCEPDHARLVHFTKGTPCFEGYENQPFADLWFDEFRHMTSHA